MPMTRLTDNNVLTEYILSNCNIDELQNMDVTKEILDTIHWKALTVFQNECLVVLECVNNQQSLDFIKLLLTNDFTFKIGENGNGFPAYVITFKNSGLIKYLIAADDKLFKYFDNNQIKWLTTGFNSESGDVACHDDRIDIRGMKFYELN